MLKPQKDLEQDFIGALLYKPEKYFAVADRVELHDLTEESARVIYKAVGEMWRDSQPIDVRTVALRVGMKHAPWVAGDAMAPSAFAESFAEEIAKRAKKRRLSVALAGLAAKKGPLDEPDELLHEMQQLYREEAGNHKTTADITSVVSRFKRVQRENKERGRLGLSTGFTMLDNDYITYQPGHLWVVGAWTSTGKTAWAIEAINRLYDGRENPSVAVFSTEMTEEQNVARMVANHTGINSNLLLSGRLVGQAAEAVDSCVDRITRRRLFIFDKIRDMAAIDIQARKIKMQHGLDVVFIDFIQNIRKPGFKSKYEMMSDIAIDLQALAKDLRCTIVCLSQIPNSAGKEDAGILEYKGAGEIAAACDLGVLLKRSKEDKTVVLWETRKNRHGPCNKFILRYSQDWTRLEEGGAA